MNLNFSRVDLVPVLVLILVQALVLGLVLVLARLSPVFTATRPLVALERVWTVDDRTETEDGNEDEKGTK